MSWTIRELTPDEYPDTQLRYEVRDETDVVSLHCWEEDAKQMAAVPLMLEALESAREYVGNAVTNCRECGEADAIAKRDQMISTIDAAIAATK